jgi:phytoene dehydrogenase-like protein
MAPDAIVIGGGQNGLAAAVQLARKGRKVVVLERRSNVGGLCGAVEFHPGYRVPGILHDEGIFEPRIASALGLDQHGLRFRPLPPVFLAEAGNRGLLLEREPAAAAEELGARSPADAKSYARYRGFFARLRGLIEDVVTTPPPPLSPHGAGELWSVAMKGLKLWKLGRPDTLELMRVAPMCVADFLNESFVTPLLVEGLAAPAVLSTWAGPWSAGTNTNLILHEAGPGCEVVGGPAGLIAALGRAALAAGVEVRTGADVTRIRMASNRVQGVTLRSGEALDAPLVIATCDPKTCFLGLIAPGTLPIRIEEEYRRIRTRGTAAKLHLALDRPLELAARPGQPFEHIRIGGGNIDDLERAFDAIKYHEMSEKPHLEIRVPTVSDSTLAPSGHHVASILVSYVPEHPSGGWTEERRERLVASVLGVLEHHAPGIQDHVVAHELLTPVDLAASYALSGGQLHHGERALDQMLVLRPTPSAARYVTSVSGLVLGGSGSHGGGGVNCVAGILAADAASVSRSGNGLR